MTIRPLVNYLKIEREDQEGPTMIQSVYMRVSEANQCVEALI